MKNIYDSDEYKRFNKFTDEEFKKIGLQSIDIMQEVNTEGKPIAIPRLIVKLTNDREIIVDGYNHMIDILTTLSNIIDSDTNSKFHMHIIHLIEKYTGGINMIYATNDTYIVSNTITKQHITFKIDKNASDIWIMNDFNEARFVKQLILAINNEFLNKYGSTKRTFYTDGVYWWTDDNKEALTNEQIDIMLNNTIAGHWTTQDGKFEKRRNIRTWTSSITYEEACNIIKESSTSEPDSPIPHMINGIEFKDLSSEIFRSYEFPDGKIVKINKPLWINISKSGGHRVLDERGYSHYIPSGWIHLQWKAKDCMSPFVF